MNLAQDRIVVNGPVPLSDGNSLLCYATVSFKASIFLISDAQIR
jgi:hypothetical protein